MKKIVLYFLVFLFCASVAFAQDKWHEYKAAHFVIFYKEIPLSFIKSIEEAAENDYRAITRNLGFHREQNWMADNRVKIYVYQDASDYTRNGQQYQWSHGTASVVELAIRTFPSAHGFFDSTLPHEMGHIIFREFVGLKADAPLWFEEGVAMYQEKAKRFGANGTVKESLKKGEFISLMDLTNMRLYNDSPKDKLNLFYAESASVVYYLISELGEYKFVRLCRALKEGKDFPEALKSAYIRFHDLEDLNRAWLNYLEQTK